MHRSSAAAPVLLAAVACAGPSLPDDDAAEPSLGGLTERPDNPDCVAFARPSAPGGVRLQRAFPEVRLAFILALEPDPFRPGWVAATKEGRVWRWSDAEDASEELVLDHRAVVDDRPNEGGLLGLALHPDVAQNGEVFLSYTTQTGDGLASRVSRFRTTDGLESLDPASEEVLLEVAQPYGNHNGGDIAFGPDGFLYVALGDGGAAGDPLGSGQDTDTLLGSILRIDVDGGEPYAIPEDNPLADGGGRPEIFAWGLRNPWQMAFDPKTGELWTGDVGQDAIEEIDRVELGGNYGWNLKEGTSCYRRDTCEGSFVDPVVEYGHDQGQSVTGGVVLRDPDLPALDGSYLYIDFRTGRLWGVVYDPETGEPTGRLLIEDTGLNVAVMGQAPDGSVLIPHFYSGLYTLEPEEGEVVRAPATLSETGCADASDPTRPSSGLVPYVPIHPFWSDGAEKARWMGLPDGTTASVRPDGSLDLPVGTVLRKDFERGGERISTRLMVHHDDGWAGYVYRWRGDGSDADLVNGVIDEAGGGDWHFPGQAACMQCHTEPAGRGLGTQLAQLAHPIDYGDGTPAHQLEVLDRIGLIEGIPEGIEPLASRDDADVEAAARAWLHVNCASCHQPEAAAVDLDLRVTTPLADMAACDVVPERGGLGVEDARLIAPGDPSRSVLLTRLRDRGAYAMPPVGALRVDEEGAARVEAWIAGLEGCP